MASVLAVQTVLGAPMTAETGRGTGPGESAIQISGVVHTERADGHEIVLRVGTRDAVITVRGPRPSRHASLVDAEVTLTGRWAASGEAPAPGSQRVLLIARASDIHVIRQPPADPDGLRSVSFDALLDDRQANAPLHRVKITGTVTACLSGRMLYVTDGTRDLHVRLLDPASLSPGDVVEVRGFVRIGSAPASLADAVVRKIGAGEPPNPTRLDAARLPNTNYHNGLVLVEATFVRHSIDADDYELVLQSDGVTFDAGLPKNTNGSALDALVPGSRLEITGIASVRTGTDGDPMSFHIHLRDAGGVKLLALPSWWTLKHALYLLVFVVIGLVACGGWVVALRRRLPAVERARLESEERYRQLFERAPAGHFVTDASGRLTACNEAFARMLGFSSAADAIGANCEPLHANPDDREGWLALLRHGTPIENRTVTLKTVDWRDVPALETAAAECDAQGAVIQVQGFLIDRTESQRAEVALRERDAQLRQSQKMESIGRLAGGVAHDFNNLLTVIAGFSELAERECGDRPDVGELIAQVRKAADTGAGLTRQLLAFSRKQAFDPTVLDANVVVADMDKILRRLLGEDIRLTVHTWSAPLYVKADRAHLEQVLVNLAVNARDAMPHGGTLEIQAGADGVNVHLIVTDTGCGMDEEILGRIFEPFFTTKEPGRGTGLGLAMVYGAIAQCGGSIQVASTPLRGSTFTIALPLAAAPADRPCGDDGPCRRVCSETILLVEDDDAVRKLAQEVLERAGYTVVAAADGCEALHLAEHRCGTIDLVLSDVVMPGLGGKDVAHWFAKKRPSTPVVLMSGYADHPALKTQAPPMNVALLQKPFTSATLHDTVRQALARC